MTQPPPWSGPDETTPDPPGPPDQPGPPGPPGPPVPPGQPGSPTADPYRAPPPPAAPPPGQQPGYGQQPGQQPGYGQPNPAYGVAPYADPQAKSKIAAGLLGVFLGGLGVHRFYLGYTKIGVIQIVVTVLTCGIGSLWGFVEGILYLVGANGWTTDSTGRPLHD